VICPRLSCLRPHRKKLSELLFINQDVTILRDQVTQGKMGIIFNIWMNLKGIGIGYVDIIPIPIYRMRPISDNHE
jgi:hypothetical protein